MDENELEWLTNESSELKKILGSGVRYQKMKCVVI